MTEYHPLFWVFKVTECALKDNEYIAATEITESDFELAGAPAWVWIAYQEAMENYINAKVNSFS